MNWNVTDTREPVSTQDLGKSGLKLYSAENVDSKEVFLRR